MGSIRIKVVPKASRSQVVGWEEDLLKVRVAAVPEKGKANKELIRLLSKVLSVPKTSIRVIAGETGRLKRIEVEELSDEELRNRMNG